MLVDVLIYPIRFEGKLGKEFTNKVEEILYNADADYISGVVKGTITPHPQKYFEILANKFRENNIPFIYLRKITVPDANPGDFVERLAGIFYRAIIFEKFDKIKPSPDVRVSEVKAEYLPIAEDAIDPPEASSSNSMESMLSLLLLSIPMLTLIGLWLSNIFKK
jgi:hypothetical protein